MVCMKWICFHEDNLMGSPFESVSKRTPWKAHFFLKPCKKQDNVKKAWDFKPRLHPQQHFKLQDF